MQNFKEQLKEKYINHFNTLIDCVAGVEYKDSACAIKDKKHIDVIVKYTNYVANKTEADLMDLFSKSLFSNVETNEFSAEQVLSKTDELLEKQKMLFSKGFLSCFQSLKKNAGHIYSDDTLKKCIVVNCGTRLKIAKDEFTKWSENIKEIDQNASKNVQNLQKNA